MSAVHQLLPPLACKNDGVRLVSGKSTSTLEELEALLALLESATHITQFSLVDGNSEIRLSRLATGTFGDPTTTELPQATAAPIAVSREDGQPQAPAPAITVKSPTVGTFLRGSALGAEPMVKVGTTVQPDTVICNIKIIQNLMALPAATTGTVSAVLVDDGEPIEFGQPLVTIEPLG